MEEAFDRYAPLLLAVAYRMLRSASDAEDIVQECYVRYAQASAKEIHSLKSYLTTTVIRLCLDHLKSARVQRENDSGSRLPEQLLTTNLEDVVLSILEQREAIAVAFQVLLERLTPDERAVFLLYEVFDYRYGEIAEIIGKSVVHCRQLLHRAKKHLGGSHARFTLSPLAQQRLVECFLGACQLGDLQVLIDLLTQDVTRWAHVRESPCFAEEGLR
jgi:RNA polymerase sigma-70 factor, ECF subfamily